ncbi:MAG: hypothetical protein H8E66_34240 [Planctomycetes bacterium]|nr:hypothetical protein [Planctomycetota bacterium]
MSTEFGCCECGKLLRIPETSAGNKVRCPACGSVQEVPTEVKATPSRSSDHAPDQQESPTPQSESTFAASSTSANPFADGAPPASDSPFAADATNPYATPTSGRGMTSRGLFGPGSRVWARTCVDGPANSLAAVGGVAVIFSGIGLIINLFEFLESGNIGVAVYMVVATVSLMVPYGIVIYGATRMKQLENYKLAIAASILAMLPCSGCCILGLPVGIWSLVVLCNPNIRAAFR